MESIYWLEVCRNEGIKELFTEGFEKKDKPQLIPLLEG